SRVARASVRSRALRTSQIAAAMLMPTRIRPSAIRARPSGMRESLLLRGANQLRDGAEQLGAFDRLGERARRAGVHRVLRRGALAGAEMPGHRDQLQGGMLLAHPLDRLGAA